MTCFDDVAPPASRRDDDGDGWNGVGARLECQQDRHDLLGFDVVGGAGDARWVAAWEGAKDAAWFQMNDPESATAGKSEAELVVRLLSRSGFDVPVEKVEARLRFERRLIRAAQRSETRRDVVPVDVFADAA